jgi:hypothetical protein
MVYVCHTKQESSRSYRLSPVPGATEDIKTTSHARAPVTPIQITLPSCVRSLALLIRHVHRPHPHTTPPRLYQMVIALPPLINLPSNSATSQRHRHSAMLRCPQWHQPATRAAEMRILRLRSLWAKKVCTQSEPVVEVY